MSRTPVFQWVLAISHCSFFRNHSFDVAAVNPLKLVSTAIQNPMKPAGNLRSLRFGDVELTNPG
jgi:hypothetical protein